MSHRIRVAFLLALSACSFDVNAQNAQPTRKMVDKVGILNGLPINFEENRGQAETGAHFIARGQGYSLLLTDTDAILRLSSDRGRHAHDRPNFGLPVPQPSVRPSQNIPHRILKIKFRGKSKSLKVVGLSPLPGRINYFTGNDRTKWTTDIPTFAKVTYKELYSGIDLVFYGNRDRLETDFIVAPGADLSRARFQIEGADGLHVKQNGDLAIDAGGEVLLLTKPVFYQPSGSGKQLVDGRYVLNGSDEISFQVSPYDESKTLVVDPVLVYSTYLGGSSTDVATGVAVNPDGSVIVTGLTTSLDFPTTAGSVQSVPSSTAAVGSIFVTKIAPDGKTLLYSTFLSTNQFTTPSAISVDPAGNAYIVGSTLATDFPTVNAFQDGCHECNPNASTDDVFLTKLNPNGSTLLYSSYLGGDAMDFGMALAVDGVGNAYIAGITRSINFPTTNTAFDTTCGSDGNCNPDTFGQAVFDGFAAKFDTTRAGASSLIYSTFIGGNSVDEVFGIAIDGSGNAYLTGTTSSSDFPTTPNAFQTQCENPQGACFQVDAFITKLNPTGSALVYSTYLGGSATQVADAIAVDLSGNAFVTGWTSSTDFPTTPGSFQNSVPLGGSTLNAFVTKMNATGSGQLYSTYLGGGDFDEGDAIAIDATGSASILGRTGSIDFPLQNPLQAHFGGGFSDIFISSLNPAGSGLFFSTFLGGNDNDGSITADGFRVGGGIRLDAAGNIYIAQATLSPNFPTTTGAYQTALNNSSYDAFVTKIQPQSGTTFLPTISSISPVSAKQGNTVSNFVVTGSNFSANATVSFNTPGINVLSYRSSTSTQIRCAINIATSTHAGAYDVSVRNPDSAADTLRGSFTVVSLPPSVARISPVNAIQGETISNFTVAGSNFDDGAMLTFGRTGVTVNNYISRSPSQIVANITVSFTAATGTRNVIVTNSDSKRSTLVSAFTVTPFFSSVLWRGLSGPWNSTCTKTFGAIAIHPKAPKIIYIGSSDASAGCGIFKSVDGGLSWSEINSGIPKVGIGPFQHYSPITKIAIAPTSQKVVYAGTFEDIGIALLGHMYASTDAGQVWSDASGPTNILGVSQINAPVLDIAVSPKAAGTVFVGLVGKGISKTTDNGAHWTSVRPDNVGVGSTDYFSVVRVAPSNAKRLFSSGYTHFNTDILPCTFSPGGTGGDCLPIDGILPLIPIQSNDGGKTWGPLERPDAFAYFSDIAIDPANENTLYASTLSYMTPIAITVGNKGIFKSVDGGVTWQASNGTTGVDLSQTPIFRLLIDPNAPNTIYAVAGFSGVFRSMDGGNTWTALTLNGLPDSTIIVNISVANGRIFALTSNGPYAIDSP